MTAAAAACEALLQMEGQMLGNRSSLGERQRPWLTYSLTQSLTANSCFRHCSNQSGWFYIQDARVRGLCHRYQLVSSHQPLALTSSCCLIARGVNHIVLQSQHCNSLSMIFFCKLYCKLYFTSWQTVMYCTALYIIQSQYIIFYPTL